MEHAKKEIRENYPHLLYREFPVDPISFLMKAIQEIGKDNRIIGDTLSSLVDNVESLDISCRGIFIASLLMLFDDAPKEISPSIDLLGMMDNLLPRNGSQ